MALMRTDQRKNFKQLPSRITFLSAVDDGIYVSDLDRTYFMGGGDPGEAVLIGKAGFPETPHTTQKVDAARVGGLGLGGTGVLWASKMGICLGRGGGQFKNLTEDFYRTEGLPVGEASMVREMVGPFNLFACLGPKKLFPFIISQCHCTMSLPN
jgi:hypothetical protein